MVLDDDQLLLSGASFLCLIVLFVGIGVGVSGGDGHFDEKPFVLLIDLLLVASLAALGTSAVYAWKFRPFSHLATMLAFFVANNVLLLYALGVGALVNSL